MTDACRKDELAAMIIINIARRSPLKNQTIRLNKGKYYKYELFKKIIF